MAVTFEWYWLLVIAAAIAVLAFSSFRRSRVSMTSSVPGRAPSRVNVISGAVNVRRPNSHTVEGLEIQYGTDQLVRSVRVGAMNQEHKELLLTMDEVAWRALPNAQKQEVIAAARSTWAAKMCPDGPDIAYVVVQTDRGEVVGRADPHSVTIL